ncbi:Grx4 family monothiol glutaredoxin [Natronospira bacteriovora]|uniref:Glutaredoxin n=1 Tax=Natronospira bacteriovora TaxID=3069753 RepID=A0ABU0W5Q4_9GAMM|nr:Grx4 family monothiol glutaredoxin [Natronospira sp. AB-CW4]MDQ2069357.1 Grx4 family monothiol glutaredoxin [Natronospira sp. AB-CW4]
MDIEQKIKEQLGDNAILLYMKGTPDFPQCGFSAQTAQVMKQIGVPFAYFNILEDQELRERLKEYSNWPTYPQLYVKGELIGGCDIIMEMFQSGELEKELKAASEG